MRMNADGKGGFWRLFGGAPGAVGEREADAGDDPGRDGDEGGLGAGLAEVVAHREHDDAEVAGLFLHFGGLFFVIAVEQGIVCRGGFVNRAKDIYQTGGDDADDEDEEANLVESLGWANRRHEAVWWE